MAIWVLVLFGIYFGAAFVGRALIHVQQTGDSPLKRPQAKPFSAEWFAILSLGAGVLSGVAGPVLALLNLSQPLAPIDGPSLRAIGFILFGVGLATMFWAQMTMGASWRVGVDTEERTTLVTSGLFSLVRNPIYSAGFLMSLGLLLILPAPAMAVSLLLFSIGVEIHVRIVEEPYLGSVHQTAYARYAASVGRFVPLVRRLSRPTFA